VLAPYADFLATAATVWGVVGAFSSLLQARQLARTRSAESVSLGFLAKYLGGYVTWALYGIAIGSTPLIVVDVIGICTSSLTVGVALRVRRGAGEAVIGRGRDPRLALGS
jgi:MtN3 and saliva related transmembrane protein